VYTLAAEELVAGASSRFSSARRSAVQGFLAMETAAQAECRIRFAPFELNLTTRELSRNGRKIRLQGHPIDLLLMLLDKPGAVVSRESLQKRIWPQDTFVDFEHGLNVTVNRLREALGDRAEEPQFIETLPRVGYRFIARVEWLHAAAAVPENANGTPSAIDISLPGGPLFPVAPGGNHEPDMVARKPLSDPTRDSNSANLSVPSRARLWSWLSLPIGAAIVCGAGFWIFHRPMPSPHITDYIQLTHDSKFKEVAATDGNRIYVNLLETDAVLQAPITGGELAPIPIQFPGEERPIPGLAPGDFPFVYDLSKDGSTFLCAGPTYSLWSVTTTGNLIRLLGTAQGAAWSPDGRNIVYTWRGDIFLMRSDGTDSRMLVPSKAFPDASQSNSDLSWSPNGSHIRFTRDHELWEVSPSGSDLRSLLPGWRPTSWKSNGRWTPDGDFFIFLTGEPNLIPLPFGNRLWALDERRSWFAAPGLQPIPLTSGPTRWGHPVPSRDGTKIYARGSVLDGELLRFDERERMWSPFLGGRSVEFVTFSPDRKAVAYATFPDEVLYRANADGTGPIQLTEPPIAVKSLQWSPDGSQILVNAQNATEKVRMYIVPATGGPLKSLIPEDSEPEMDSHWSPDGARVVYSNLGNPWETLHPVEIRLLDLASRRTTALPGSGEDFSPRWSPDGRYIAALTISEHKLRVFDLKSKSWTTIYDGVASSPIWSGDGQFIYFLGADRIGQAIIRIPFRGGKPKVIAELKNLSGTGSYGHWFGLYPGDAPLFLRDMGRDEVYSLPFARK
jgi:Tol biopolymer transport system component/DNA-binding winged helix-turn-helix (wHTH) protein